MENQFFVDSEFLSPEALKRKHELETNPASRKNHMEYMPGMEIIKSDIRETVMAHVEEYDYDKYRRQEMCARHLIMKPALWRISRRCFPLRRLPS